MEERYTLYPRTLVFLFNQDQVLLIRRSPNAQLFPGMYNGVGGHVERGEDVLTAARREVREETGLPELDLKLRCLLHVDEGADRPGVLVFVFVGTTHQRNVIETEEGGLHWIALHDIGQLNLLPDLPQLLEHLLSYPPDAPPTFAHSKIYPENGTWEIQFVS